MVRALLFSIAVASSLIVGTVAAPLNSFDQEDNFEREFDLAEDLDLVSRYDMSDLAVRDPLFGLFSAVGSAISGAISLAKAAKARKAAARAANGGAPPQKHKKEKKQKQNRKKGKRELLDDDEELLQRADDMVEFFTRYLEDNEIEGSERRGWAESESLEALD